MKIRTGYAVFENGKKVKEVNQPWEEVSKPRIMYASLNSQGNIKTIHPYKWWFPSEQRKKVVRISVKFDKVQRHITVVPHIYERLPK